MTKEDEKIDAEQDDKVPKHNGLNGKNDFWCEHAAIIADDIDHLFEKSESNSGVLCAFEIHSNHQNQT